MLGLRFVDPLILLFPFWNSFSYIVCLVVKFLLSNCSFGWLVILFTLSYLNCNFQLSVGIFLDFCCCSLYYFEAAGAVVSPAIFCCCCCWCNRWSWQRLGNRRSDRRAVQWPKVVKLCESTIVVFHFMFSFSFTLSTPKGLH